MTEVEKLVCDVHPHGLLSLSDQLVFYQSHHHALFLEQSIADALGGEGWAVRQKAAFEASHALLSSLIKELGVAGPKETLDLAAEVFAAMGQGRLAFEITPEGGSARAEALFHGSSFVEKYGSMVNTKHAADAFAAGFCSAAASLAYPSDQGVLDAEETSCVARRDPACSFTLARRPEPPRLGAVLTRSAAEATVEQLSVDTSRADLSERAPSIARALAGAAASEAGVTRAFGARVALMPVSYTNQVTYDTMHLVEKRTPELFPVFTALVREAAQMGTFYLLAGVLASPEWTALHGPPAEGARERLAQLIAITRALGWGALEAVELTEGRTLVLKSSVTHESAYYAVRHGNSARGRLAFQQGMALAIMQILHRVDFSAGPPRLTREAYNALFQSGTRFLAEETRSPLRGDDVSEVIVEAIAD